MDELMTEEIRIDWECDDFTETYADDAFEGMPKGFNPINRNIGFVVLQEDWIENGPRGKPHRNIIKAKICAVVHQ